MEQQEYFDLLRKLDSKARAFGFFLHCWDGDQFTLHTEPDTERGPAAPASHTFLSREELETFLYNCERSGQ